MKPLTVKDMEHVAFVLAQEMLVFNEPIPNFSSRYPHILESSLATPFQTFGGKPLYPSLTAKASILFYLMIKNHPFQNGNKRIAMATLFVFLFRNQKWVKVDTYELYKFTVWIADSPPKPKARTLKAIEDFLKEHLVDIYECTKTETNTETKQNISKSARLKSNPTLPEMFQVSWKHALEWWGMV